MNLTEYKSHPPQRPIPKPRDRPLGNGPNYYVHPTEGSNENAGSLAAPWRTIAHSLKQLTPGDTLVLRGGTYFENVYCAIAGTEEQPITIRSAPNELAIIDAGIPEFQLDPTTAWQPSSDGVAGEYESTNTLKNIRDVVGRFADGMCGLQTYWYRMDLQSDEERWIPCDELMVEPIWCGPGLWYNKQTGRIHARLAHTSLTYPEEVGLVVDQYQGETDPRKLPLIISRFNAMALNADQAMHVNFQDIVFRGGGLITVKLNFAVNLKFDHCTIYAGGYGIWSKGAGPLEMSHCGVFGMIAPWMFRHENCSYAYSPKVYPPFTGSSVQPERGTKTGRMKMKQQAVRHISRLPTHAVLVTEGGYEFETFYYPLNHDWHVHHCEFTDGHDGIYLSGHDIDFHHNLVDDMQDDSVYVSSPTPHVTDGLYIHQNLIRRGVTAFGAHARGGPGGKIYIYRNIIDMRKLLQYNRPTDNNPAGKIHSGNGFWLVHNPDHILHMEETYLYHNTVVARPKLVDFGYCCGAAMHFHQQTPRRVMNNIFVYDGGIDRYPEIFRHNKYEDADLVIDGQLHFHSDPNVTPPTDMLQQANEHPLSEKNKSQYPDGWEANSIIADPQFVSFTPKTLQDMDLRLAEASPAINAGVPLPEEWPDSRRDTEKKKPDIGALPFGAEPLRVGVDGRTVAGEAN